MAQLCTVYCIDTSALVDAWRPYPRDLFAVWDQLERLVREGRLIAPSKVLTELQRKSDALLRWAQKHRRMFKRLDGEQLRLCAEICRLFPRLVDTSKAMEDAEPYVVALAVENTRKRSGETLFERHEYVVVTQERLSRPGERPRIPNVCQHYGLRWVNLFDMFRREGWRFEV